MSNANGRVIWEGESLLDGSPIVVIAIGFENSSRNRKTGNMIQTYILRRDISPVDAVQSGADFSICGSCVHRGTVEPVRKGKGRVKIKYRNKGRTCYVNLGQGPLGVYRTYVRSVYPEWDGTGIAGRIVRLGTYGDPAAVPVSVWENLLREAAGFTGYTHQWRDHRFASLRKFCMASADTALDALTAQAKGWRTFRVSLNAERDPRSKTEALCPASAEAGKKLTCDRCLACDGTATNRRGSVYIPAHGGTAVMANVRRRDLGLAA